MIKMKKIYLLIIVTTLMSGCIAQTNPYQMEYAGEKVNFRANLNEAAKVLVEPSEKDLQFLLLSPYVNQINIAFVPSDENKFYSVAGYEITYKLMKIRAANLGQKTQIQSLILNKSEDAQRLASKENPIILMEGGVNETKVLRAGSVIYVRGKDMTEKNRDYTDLDLAADKLLLALMKAGQ